MQKRRDLHANVMNNQKKNEARISLSLSQFIVESLFVRYLLIVHETKICMHIYSIGRNQFLPSFAFLEIIINKKTKNIRTLKKISV